MTKCDRCHEEGNNFILAGLQGRLCLKCKKELDGKLYEKHNRKTSMIYPVEEN